MAMAIPTHIDLQIVTPDRPIVHEQVDEVEIPGAEGYFGVLPGHTPLLASLAVGELWYRKGQEKTYLVDRVRVRRGAARPRDDPGAARRARRGDRRRARGGGAQARRGAARARQGRTSTTSAPASR